MKTILLFRTSFHPGMRSDYEYLYSYAKTHDWQVQTINYMNAAVSRLWNDNAAPVPNIKETLEFWHPDGCIVECGGIPHEPWEHLFKGVPVVYLDRPQPEDDPSAVCVSDNPQEVAAVAARELLSLNFDEYAFVAFHNPLPWSEERGRWFRRYVLQNGKQCHMFRMPRSDAGGKHIQAAAEFIRSLPKPCGLFAANDETAQSVVNACMRINVQIPYDVAIVGVDDEVEICENLPVTLTSIKNDVNAAIMQSVDLLAELLSPRRKKVRSAKFRVKKIVRRASTSGLRSSDRRVAAAMEYIRVNAFGKISCKDVISVMGCSERLGNMLFRKCSGHTILDEIHTRRIESAKEHLASGDKSMEMIAGLCGYDSASDFGRVFKRYVGTTPRQWRDDH